MKKLIIFFALIVVLMIPVSYSLTASIGNARMVLRPVIEDGQPVVIDKSILVKNVNDIAVKVTLEPDQNYKKIITMIDSELTLQPGESRDARFKITLKSGGSYEGRINVGFSPADPDSKENPVGLASNIIIVAEGPVTEHYYEVMGDPDEETETEEDIETEEEEEETEEDIEAEREEENTVSVSLGGTKPPAKTETKTVAENNEAAQDGANPLIGIGIIIVIIGIGSGVFFLIKKLLK